jgi:transcriptional regulator with XRE-family HTH domain
MELREAFAVALRNTRVRCGLTQEDFGIVSSRTYLSTLERGLKNVTLEKASELADRMDVHPLTLLVECFLLRDPDSDIDSLFERIRREIEAGMRDSSSSGADLSSNRT